MTVNNLMVQLSMPTFTASAELDLQFSNSLYLYNGTYRTNPANVPGWSYTRTGAETGIATALDLAGNVIQFPSRTNLLLRSQEFDDAAWLKQVCSVTANSSAAPDGSTTAELVTEASTSGTEVSQVVTVSSGATVAFSVFAKRSSFDWVRITISNAGNTSAVRAWFNVQTGQTGSTAVVGTGVASSISIAAAGNGWYRLTLIGSMSGETSYRCLTTSAAADASTARVDGGTYLIWGAQLELGSTTTAYIPTTTAAVTVALPRITNRGILVEEARTNKLTAFNANPDAALTDFSKSGDGSSTFTRVNDAAELAVAGLAGVATSGLVFKVDNSLGATSIRITSFTLCGNTNSHTASCWIRGAGSVSLQINSSETYTSLTAGYARRTTTQTPSSAARPWILAVAAGSVAYFILPQLEEGAFATSPIITTGAAGTRGADTPVVTGLAGLLLNTGYTLVAECEAPPAGLSATGSNQKWMAAVSSSGGGGVGFYAFDATGAFTGGVSNTGDTPASPAVAAAVYKMAQAVIPNGNSSTLRMSVNGSDILTGTNAINASVADRLMPGTRNDSFQRPAETYIRRVRALPYFATDAQLQALTAP